MTASIIVAIVSGVVSVSIALGAVAINTGKLVEKIRVIEDRAKEDRELFFKRLDDNKKSADTKFRELYLSRNEMKSEIVEHTASCANICQRLERLEIAIERLSEKLDGLK